ncbi:uncharacterized protein LOC120840917 [Ixodes scapularis]|uniref:uncharacterized protein LOC120840917 n=1 Tax=Ixodes scapularis TaxID=6945 RepID=UPI001C38D82D|nr:uncharacterized protein LOC120840917 [Ixodes scapularis]
MSRGIFRKAKSTSDTPTEGQRRVSFLEKPFAEVLHIIKEEEDSSDERKGSSASKSNEKLSTSGSAVLKILESSPKQTNLEGTERHPDDAFVVYQAETNVFKTQMVAVTRSGQSDHSPSLTTSQPVNRGYKLSLVHHQPFCGSDEGPLAPSPCTSLSFVSSESGHNVMHPLTDLALLRGLLPCRRPKYETGDGRSRTGQLSRALSAGTHTEEAATRTSQQAFGRTQQSSVGDRRRGSSVWPRTGARQALVRCRPEDPPGPPRSAPNTTSVKDMPFLEPQLWIQRQPRTKRNTAFSRRSLLWPHRLQTQLLKILQGP